MTKTYNFNVLFMPEDETTVDKIRVVDSWSTNDKSDTTARKWLLHFVSEDHEGRYSRLGKGRFTVVRCIADQYI